MRGWILLVLGMCGLTCWDTQMRQSEMEYFEYGDLIGMDVATLDARYEAIFREGLDFSVVANQYSFIPDKNWERIYLPNWSGEAYYVGVQLDSAGKVSQVELIWDDAYSDL
ncbi:MAG: hypothetical protein ABI743_00980 [bacterium]